MERIVQFQPAFDKRHKDPNKNYGIHGVTLRMVLKGKNGAVQFVVYTNWHLPHVQEELNSKSLDWELRGPMPADLGYHSPHPMYEGQQPMRGTCDILGTQCYYDGSTLNSEPVFERLLEEGDAGVWAELESYYESHFGRDSI